MATVVIGTAGNVDRYVGVTADMVKSIKTLLIMSPDLLALNPVNVKYVTINVKSLRDALEPMSSSGVGINGVSQFFA